MGLSTMKLNDVVLCLTFFCCGMLIVSFQNFYGCDNSVTDSFLMLAVDIYRIIATVVLVGTVYVSENTSYSLSDSKLIFSIFALGSLATFLIHIVKISQTHSDDYCLMKNTAANDWKLELQKIFKNDDVCAIDAGSKNVVETMENPHVMTSASSWCTERIQKRCVTRELKFDTIMDCLRHGATDLVQHLQYIYVFDLVGDACRFVLFTKFAMLKQLHKKGYATIEQNNDASKTEKIRL